jgi:hypothetical protein
MKSQSKPPAKPKPRATLTTHDVARIRAETMCDESTIRAWAKGALVRQATDVRIKRAAAKLGIQP